jgi:hypothetical protein
MDSGTEPKAELGWLNPDLIAAFLEELKAAGYNIGIDQFILVQNLILTLSTQDQVLDDPQTLGRLLGPIVCHSPTEQAEFPRHFQRWLQRVNPSLQPDPIDPDAQAQVQALTEELEEIEHRSRRLPWLLGLGAVAMAGILFPLVFWGFRSLNARFFPPPDPEPTTAVVDTPAIPEPEPPNEVVVVPEPELPNETAAAPEPEPTDEIPVVPELEVPVEAPIVPPELENESRSLILWPTIVMVLIIVASGTYGGWRLWWRWRAQVFLQRRSTSQRPQLDQIPLSTANSSLFEPSPSFRSMAQRLHQRVAIPSQALNVEATIAASLAQGGSLCPVYQSRLILPEYLCLIDRTTYDDHQAHLIDGMVDRLQAEGVLIERYYFARDPRLCHPHQGPGYKGQGSAQRLRQLAAKYPSHRLLVFADLDNFFNAYTGKLEPWVQQLLSWDDRAILTPNSKAGVEDQRITERFVVLPATPGGIGQLIPRLYQRSIASRATEAIFNGPSLFPQSLLNRSDHWISAEPPQVTEIQSLLLELRRYLGQDGFYWCCACAIFPKLSWPLTLFLGEVVQTVTGNDSLITTRLLDLARLPWFRYGYLPDWLRWCLIVALEPEQEQSIRVALQTWLLSAVQGLGGEFQLEVAQRNRDVLPKLLKPLLQRLAQQSDEDSPLRDYIFQDFMAGRKPSRLAVELPEQFQILLPQPGLQIETIYSQPNKEFWWSAKCISTILFILFLSSTYSLVWYLFFRPSPIPRIVDFSTHQASYTEGDFVRLDFDIIWKQQNIRMLEKVEIIAQVTQIEGTSEAPRSPEPIVIYQGFLGPKLPEGCEFITAEELRCISLATSATAAGQYTFDLNV